jgi:hypothetical protein
MVCIPHQILLGWHVKKHEIWRGGGACDTYRGEETYKHTQYFAGRGVGGLRMAAPCFTRSGLNSKPVHVEICGGRSGKEFSPSTSVYPVSNDPRLLHTHPINLDRH